MNKTEITVVVLLFALLIGWGYMSRPSALPRPASAAAKTNAAPVRLPPDTTVKASPAEEAPEPVKVEAVPEPAEAPASDEPEQTVVLADTNLSLTVSSRSGGIVTAELKEFRALVNPGSGPLRLDLSPLPALSFRGGEFASNGSYQVVSLAEDKRSVVLRRTLAGGLRLERTLRIEGGYCLKVTDAFANPATNVAALPAYGVAVGPMEVTDPKAHSQDLAFLGLDSLAAYGGERVRYWLQSSTSSMGCSAFGSSVIAQAFLAQPGQDGALPLSATHRYDSPVLWVAAKSKFFVQILYAGENTEGCEFKAWRVPGPDKKPVIMRAGATVLYPAAAVEPGASVTREVSYYLGPKKYTLLKELEGRQEEIMDFGRWFGWICKLLLPTLNGIHSVFPNYGIAVILLTILVRIVFWPVTHKSTESMKRMQELQPLVTEIRAKYKDKPQKMNQEMMALYKEHKVNPMSGCLPMLVQIPVFIALFTVLQSAVELRFAPFLWIKDLSQPENLLLGVWPLPFGLNLLPLFMTGLTLWQQKLTPTGGDPQQQKMMMWMPVIFLFMFYSMASALVLYWSVSQAISIVQMLHQRRTSAAKAAAAGVAKVTAPAPARRGK